MLDNFLKKPLLCQGFKILEVIKQTDDQTHLLHIQFPRFPRYRWAGIISPMKCQGILLDVKGTFNYYYYQNSDRPPPPLFALVRFW